MNNTKRISADPSAKNGGIFYLRPFVLVLLLGWSCFCFSQPRVTVTEAKKNFGTVKRGEVVRNVYEITNTGNEPLLITDIEISCSCTTAEFPKQPLLPGAKAGVVVIFNTKSVYGRQDRIVYLHTNDPRGEVKLRYKGTVSEKQSG